MGGKLLDLSGLPDAVAEDIVRLVETLRTNQPTPQPAPERPPLMGRFAHRGLPALTLEEFQANRREMWASDDSTTEQGASDAQ